MQIQIFLEQMFHNPMLLISVVLILGVVLVNGWTDAPNAIATCVSTRAIGVRPAIIMAAIFNFFGVLIMTTISPQVAATIYNIADFGDNSSDALIALCAAMAAIVIWATAAWYFGIPTSESHALIAGVSGAAIAIHNGSIAGINWDEWIKVFWGLALSTILGFGMGFLTSKLTTYLFRNSNRLKTAKFFNYAQIAGGASMAFMHGAQDGQKFIAIFMLAIAFANGDTNTTEFTASVPLMILCSAVMGIGTSIGGYKIIKSVGMDMVKLKPYQGFSADLAATGCLLISSLTGVPVSTTHTKTTAIMGVGAAKRIRNVNWSVVKDLVLTWVFTFPGCGLLGYIMARIFLRVF